MNKTGIVCSQLTWTLAATALAFIAKPVPNANFPRVKSVSVVPEWGAHSHALRLDCSRPGNQRGVHLPAAKTAKPSDKHAMGATPLPAPDLISCVAAHGMQDSWPVRCESYLDVQAALSGKRMDAALGCDLQYAILISAPLRPSATAVKEDAALFAALLSSIPRVAGRGWRQDRRRPIRAWPWWWDQRISHCRASRLVFGSRSTNQAGHVDF